LYCLNQSLISKITQESERGLARGRRRARRGRGSAWLPWR